MVRRTSDKRPGQCHLVDGAALDGSLNRLVSSSWQSMPTCDLAMLGMAKARSSGKSISGLIDLLSHGGAATPSSPSRVTMSSQGMRSESGSGRAALLA